MQRVSGLFGNGVLQEDPTDRAAAANQRAALDVWGAQQGNEWGKESRAQMMEQARQEALQRLAAQRQQMDLGAQLTREGWGREDARSKAQFDYLTQHDQSQAALEDARANRQHNWQVNDPQYLAAAQLLGLQIQGAKDAAEERTQKKTFIDQLKSNPSLLKDPSFRAQAQVFGVDPRAFMDEPTAAAVATETKGKVFASDPAAQAIAENKIRAAVEEALKPGLSAADNEWGTPSEQALGKARNAEQNAENAAKAIAAESGMPLDRAMAVARQHMQAYSQANAPKRFWGGRDDLINALMGPAIQKPY